MRFLPCLLFTFALTHMPGEAWACENAVELSRSEVTKLIADARAALDAGDALAALKRLDQELGWQAGEYTIRSERLQRQVDQIYAVAKSRAGGSADVRSAVQTLRDAQRRDSQNPWLRTRLAEALSRTPDGRAEALTILTGLAEKDLIVDAEGYAVLARLRQGQKDEPGAKQALARCSAMARRKEICSSTPVPDPPSKSPLPQIPPAVLRARMHEAEQNHLHPWARRPLAQ
jgi:predicted Zn-dependent protease